MKKSFTEKSLADPMTILQFIKMLEEMPAQELQIVIGIHTPTPKKVKDMVKTILSEIIFKDSQLTMKIQSAIVNALGTTILQSLRLNTTLCNTRYFASLYNKFSS